MSVDYLTAVANRLTNPTSAVRPRLHGRFEPPPAADPPTLGAEVAVTVAPDAPETVVPEDASDESVAAGAASAVERTAERRRAAAAPGSGTSRHAAGAPDAPASAVPWTEELRTDGPRGMPLSSPIEGTFATALAPPVEGRAEPALHRAHPSLTGARGDVQAGPAAMAGDVGDMSGESRRGAVPERPRVWPGAVQAGPETTNVVEVLLIDEPPAARVLPGTAAAAARAADHTERTRIAASHGSPLARVDARGAGAARARDDRHAVRAFASVVVPELREAPAPAPTVHVTIGRIEVRATPPPPSPAPRPPSRPHVMTLAEFLDPQRRGARR